MKENNYLFYVFISFSHIYLLIFIIFDAIVVNFACKSIYITPFALACRRFKYSFPNANGDSAFENLG